MTCPDSRKDHGRDVAARPQGRLGGSAGPAGQAAEAEPLLVAGLLSPAAGSLLVAGLPPPSPAGFELSDDEDEVDDPDDDEEEDEDPERLSVL